MHGELPGASDTVAPMLTGAGLTTALSGPQENTRRNPPQPYLGDVLGGDERHAARVADDEWAAHAAAIAGNVHCVGLQKKPKTRSIRRPTLSAWPSGRHTPPKAAEGTEIEAWGLQRHAQPLQPCCASLCRRERLILWFARLAALCTNASSCRNGTRKAMVGGGRACAQMLTNSPMRPARRSRRKADTRRSGRACTPRIAPFRNTSATPLRTHAQRPG